MLKGKHAIVTGGGRGIGLATARALTALGAQVSILARSKDELEDAVRSNAATRWFQADVSVESDVERAFEASKEASGPCSILVNNAGIVDMEQIENLSLERWKRVLDVNLTGAFLCTRAALRQMRPTGEGRIVNVASISATLGSARSAAYNASKWGLVGLTKCTAEEVRGTRILSVSVSPGSTETAMLKQTPFPPKMTAEEVASVIA